MLPLYGLLTVVEARAGNAELSRRAEVRESSLKIFIRLPSEFWDRLTNLPLAGCLFWLDSEFLPRIQSIGNLFSSGPHPSWTTACLAVVRTRVLKEIARSASVCARAFLMTFIGLGCSEPRESLSNLFSCVAAG